MNCPVCKDTRLTISERKGVEIDFCPDCRGVWLDRGELDKIIDRSAKMDSKTEFVPHHKEYYGKHQKKRPKSFLMELFD
jgi:Zn-finger nucleic acid-binding protein